MKGPIYEEWWFVILIILLLLLITTIFTQKKDIKLMSEFKGFKDRKTYDKLENEHIIDNELKDIKQPSDPEEFTGIKSEKLQDPRAYEIRDKIDRIIQEDEDIQILNISVVHNRIIDAGNTYVSIVSLDLLEETNTKKLVSSLVMGLTDELDLVDIKIILNYSEDRVEIVELDRVDGILAIK